MSMLEILGVITKLENYFNRVPLEETLLLQLVLQRAPYFIKIHFEMRLELATIISMSKIHN